MKSWRGVCDGKDLCLLILLIAACTHLGLLQLAHFTIGNQCVASIMEKRD